MKTLSFPILVIVFIISTALLFFPQIVTVISTKLYFNESETPNAYVVSVKRDVKLDSSYSFDQGTVFEDTRGLRFTLPWSDFKNKSEIQHGVIVAFSSGKGVLVYSKTPEGAEVQGSFQTDFFKSFDVINEIINTTPDSLSFMQSVEEVKKKAANLSLKPIYIALGTQVYEYSFQDIKGFQFGDPEKNSEVTLLAFKGNMNLRLSVIRATQAEIDLIICSLNQKPSVTSGVAPN